MSRKAFYPIFLKNIFLKIKKKMFFIGLDKNKTNFLVKNLFFFRIKNKLIILPLNIEKFNMWGTYYSIIKNYICDINRSISKLIILKGIEFKVEKKENYLLFNLGYSNSIKIIIKKNIFISISKDNKKIRIKSSNRELLGNFCNIIINLKKFNYYKDKGLRFLNDKKKKKERKKK
ncbi:hypothetical protein ACWNYI_00770 [Candidatus Vidania fulgoroideorum]